MLIANNLFAMYPFFSAVVKYIDSLTAGSSPYVVLLMKIKAVSQMEHKIAFTQIVTQIV